MVDFTKVEGKNVGEVKLFALSTCAWCKRTKKYLDDQGIGYSYVYVDKLDGDERKEALEMMKKYDYTESFPLIGIGEDKSIVGYDKRKMDKQFGV